MTALKISKENETKNFLWFVEYYSGFSVCLDKTQFNKVFEQFRYWLEDNMGSCFSAQLFRLICHADDNNKIKIMHGFPEHMVIYLLWYTSESEEKFFETWGNVQVEDIEGEGIEDE